MIRRLSKKLLSLLLLATIIAPFPYVLLIPQYAYAEPNTPATYGGASGSGANATGGSTTSWGQQAASGAVSLSMCIAAGGLTLGDGVAGALAGGLGGALASGSNYLSGIFSSIFGGGSAAGAGAAATGGGLLTGGGVTSSGVTTAGGSAAGTGAGAAAGSILPVPVLDAGANVQLGGINSQLGVANTSLGALVKIQLGIATKKNVFDCIAWAIAKMIWRSIAASVIDWINGGFNGKPAFLQNFDRFMLGIADSIAGQVIQGAGLGFLCSPFQLNIRIALAMRYAQRAPSCTLTQVIANIDNFMKDFRQGGWGAWLQFTTSPQNNAYGGLLLGEATIALRTQDAQSQQAQQLSWGGGFLSLTQQTCKNVPVSVNGMAPQMTEQCSSSIQTPGGLIAHKLQSTVDAPELSLLMANELNQIIDALSQQLILKALNGLFSLSQPTSYGDDYYRFSTPTQELSGQDAGPYYNDYTPPVVYSTTTPPVGTVPGSDALIAQMDTSLQNELQMQEKLQEALSLLDNSIQNDKTIKACWEEKASGTTAVVLSQADRTQAGIQAQGQALNLVNLGDKRKPFSDGYTQSQGIAQSLQTLMGTAANAQTAAELANITQDFYAKRAAGVYSTAATLSTMDAVVVKLRSESTVLYQSALIDMNQCRYFPDPVPAQ